MARPVLKPAALRGSDTDSPYKNTVHVFFTGTEIVDLVIFVKLLTTKWPRIRKNVDGKISNLKFEDG